MPKARRRKLLAAMGLRRYTANTIIDADELETQLVEIARTRVGINNQELQAGVIGIAVPVTDAKGRVIATVALQAPVARLTLAQAMEYVPSLQAAAAAVAPTFEGGGE
jgi:DNA-binding IclR family transcriptional regulator